MPKQAKFHGGIHPPEAKVTGAFEIQTAPLLETYVVPLQQHIGAPCNVLVKKKDTVRRGQLIAEPGGFVSAGIHAPTSGTISAVTTCTGPAGASVPAVELTSDGDDTPDDTLTPMDDWQNSAPDDLKKRIADAGIVGMGGAAFPTHVKLSPPPAKPIDLLVINGVECEPCLTADHRLMLEDPDKVLTGTQIIARILGCKKVIIGIENNKPDAIELMQTKAEKLEMEVAPLKVRYPQGAEKQLIYAVSGRRVPTGGLPMDVGAVVQNVGTAAAVAEAVLDGKPLYERITTITGTPVVKPGNWRLRVGTPLEAALTLAKGVHNDPAKIIFGGPMMGLAVYSLDVPIIKSTSGILLLNSDETSEFTSGPCIGCGQCVDVCPMNIMPGTLSVQIENERFDLAEAWHAMDCIECGCCAYMCPTYRPLVHHLKRAKAEIVARRKAEQNK
ncbi:MAG: electron transport complex subunit RsxC [Candidatus Pacebacteria bacterium]|nr:electron transport complex subunit RsxC [Candidatus Paceibacterota bacterium]